MKKISLLCFLILFLTSTVIYGGDVTVTLVGIDPLTINIKGDTQNEEAGNISIYFYFRDDGVTELDVNNVDVTQITDTFGWGTTFQTKTIETGTFDKGGHTFTRRLFYDNADLSGSPDDFWTTSGIDAIICDFTTVGTGNAFVEVFGSDGLADWSGTGHNITYANQDIPLPVELTVFNAQVNSNKVTLNWSTESEINNLGFEIWRSYKEDGQYNLLSSYNDNPDLEGQGSTSIPHEYTYVDDRVVNGQTYWYKLYDVDYNGVRTEHGPISVTVSVGGLTSLSPDIPEDYHLYQNFPNPFNPSTILQFDIPYLQNGPVDGQLVVYNSLGQKVKVLYSGELGAGKFQREWDGATSHNSTAPSGIYFARLIAGNYVQTIKMMLIR